MGIFIVFDKLKKCSIILAVNKTVCQNQINNKGGMTKASRYKLKNPFKNRIKEKAKTKSK